MKYLIWALYEKIKAIVHTKGKIFITGAGVGGFSLIPVVFGNATVQWGLEYVVRLSALGLGSLLSGALTVAGNDLYHHLKNKVKLKINGKQKRSKKRSGNRAA